MKHELQTELRKRIQLILHEIGADANLIGDRGLPIYHDATELVVAEVDGGGRQHKLIPEAATQWSKLKRAAANDGVSIFIVSAFRGFDRQLEVVQSAIAAGRSIQEILETIAPPGCSEHHSGKALDAGTLDCEPLSESFCRTNAFYWLERNADRFRFRMSFPRDNRWGYTYEPWHWYFDSTIPDEIQ